MLPITPATARLSDFSASSNKILYGEKLAVIRTIQRSIQNRGLFNPLIVAKDGNRLVVIDGRKRLAALKRLQFQGKLPRGLVRVPYIIVDQCRDIDPNILENPLKLLTNAEAYIYIQGLRRRGLSTKEIAKILFASETYVRNVISTERLSKKVRRLFMKNYINLDQAIAFASLPTQSIQDVVVHTVGPEANQKTILKVGFRISRVLKLRQANRNRQTFLAAA